jgi:hypothetical protein
VECVQSCNSKNPTAPGAAWIVLCAKNLINSHPAHSQIQFQQSLFILKSSSQYSRKRVVLSHLLTPLPLSLSIVLMMPLHLSKNIHSYNPTGNGGVCVCLTLSLVFLGKFTSICGMRPYNLFFFKSNHLFPSSTSLSHTNFTISELRCLVTSITCSVQIKQCPISFFYLSKYTSHI